MGCRGWIAGRGWAIRDHGPGLGVFSSFRTIEARPSATVAQLAALFTSSTEQNLDHPEPWSNWRRFSFPRLNGALLLRTRDDCTMIATHAIFPMYASTLPSTLAMGHATAGRSVGNGVPVSTQTTRPQIGRGYPRGGYLVRRVIGVFFSFFQAEATLSGLPFVPFILFLCAWGGKKAASRRAPAAPYVRTCIRAPTNTFSYVPLTYNAAVWTAPSGERAASQPV